MEQVQTQAKPKPKNIWAPDNPEDIDWAGVWMRVLQIVGALVILTVAIILAKVSGIPLG